MTRAAPKRHQSAAIGRLSPTARNHYRRDQQLPEAWIAAPEVRQLRALLRHRVALV